MVVVGRVPTWVDHATLTASHLKWMGTLEKSSPKTSVHLISKSILYKYIHEISIFSAKSRRLMLTFSKHQPIENCSKLCYVRNFSNLFFHHKLFSYPSPLLLLKLLLLATASILKILFVRIIRLTFGACWFKALLDDLKNFSYIKKECLPKKCCTVFVIVIL